MKTVYVELYLRLLNSPKGTTGWGRSGTNNNVIGGGKKPSDEGVAYPSSPSMMLAESMQNQVPPNEMN